eukprot:GFYU01003892.1.p1 GENE.GFYU01003892.1~~GFYU01003892.1.p1  ORF type:complete len:234 (+),score=29.83 GFYU01003892.1:19-720(+)
MSNQPSDSQTPSAPPLEHSDQPTASGSGSPPQDTDSGASGSGSGGDGLRQRKGKESAKSDSDANQFFECNICLDNVDAPVLTVCGHLFCWPCIYKWLQNSPTCPVCKAGVTKENLVPIYGRTDNPQSDPRKKVPEDIPHRPQGQRPEPVPNAQQQANAFAQGFAPAGGPQIGMFQFSAGFGPFGFFPGLFGMQFVYPPNHDGQDMTPEQRQQAFLSRMLLTVGFMVLMALVFF